LINFYSYDPGDVAVIHPFASADEVDSFLKLQDWDDIADDSFNIEKNMTGL
jgi:sulfite reductase alpha subunit-like flavoprotein